MSNDILTEEIIGDIILCEPITRKGRASLAKLGLTTDDISPAYYFDEVRVSSKYDANEKYIEEKSIDDCLYYQYTVDYLQFKTMQTRLINLDTRFCSNTPYECPLLILGVAGNGKSIDINRRLYKLTSDGEEFKCGKIYFDLEETFSEITYSKEYKIVSKTPLWVFCIKLLDGIMGYLKLCYEFRTTIHKNFYDIIVKNKLHTEQLTTLFELIGGNIDDNSREDLVFDLLTSFLNPNNVDENIKILLKILMYIMFCSSPNQKHYIVFDNIEQYIKLDGKKIQIPDSEIGKIYHLINDVLMNTINAFHRISCDLGWRAFKIVVAFRRTSVALLDPALVHSSVGSRQNTADITGYFQVSDIWRKKKEYVYNKFLKNRFDHIENKQIIEIIDLVMNDASMSTGSDYQSLIAPLMSYGIRRNARAQAHSVYELYELLINKNTAINYTEFKTIMDAAQSNNQSVKYMFRRALIEFQFKWSISSDNQKRWEKLGIGHISSKFVCDIGNKKTVVEKVDYFNKNHITFLRRVLIYLTYYPETNSGVGIMDNDRSIVDMYSTISLYDLVCGVLINPLEDNLVTDDDYLCLARVLIALSDMSNEDTRSAPYVVLGINDEEFHSKPNAIVLSRLLRKIREAGYEESIPNGKYNCSDFGIRITSAGCSFVLDWQASYSFATALYCHTIPPLFLLKDISHIKYVIETVYNCSLDLCEKYEEEAEKFCGNNVTLKTGKYLQRWNGKYITFKQRVKDLHTKHLQLYREYIEKNYTHLNISQEDAIELTQRGDGYINGFIKKYNSWKINEDDKECF